MNRYECTTLEYKDKNEYTCIKHFYKYHIHDFLAHNSSLITDRVPIEKIIKLIVYIISKMTSLFHITQLRNKSHF